MSHPHDPYRRPEPENGAQPRPVDDDRRADSIREDHGDVSHSAPPALPAPIVWDRSGAPARAHAWAAPDPFAPPQERPAPPTPVTESEVAPVAFPDSVPAPQQPHRDRTQHPHPQSPQTPAVEQTPAAGPAADADEEALTIGRGHGNSIVLDDMLVSRHHVRITAADDGLVLQDLGSRNGTYVNGQRVERTALHEGDRLGVGSTTFEVRDGWLVSV